MSRRPIWLTVPYRKLLPTITPRPWVGLTEDEVNEIYKVVRPDVLEFWRRCEAKLKTKNERKEMK
jgi:hypothetical protein